MFNQNFKVMKQRIFTLVMMLALVIVAGSAMAQTKFAPYPGGTYSYGIPIDIVNQSDATLTATGLTTGTSTISGISPSLTNIAATETEITFNIAYSSNATGTCRIAFSITDEVSGCSNNTYYDVTMAALPTYTLTIAQNVTGYSACQARTGAGQDSPDALGDDTEANTFTFTVTPSFTGLPATYDFDYNISLPNGGSLLSFNNGSGSVTGYSGGVVSRDETNIGDAHVYTVTFNTTTGIATVPLTATLTLAGSELTLPVIYGGGTYTATMAGGGSLTQTVNANAVPGIGSFN
jgi:hypothetical protein